MYLMSLALLVAVLQQLHKIGFQPDAFGSSFLTCRRCRSLQRALNRRLYLLIRGIPYGGSKDTPVWHFPEKEYAKEESLRKVYTVFMVPTGTVQHFLCASLIMIMFTSNGFPLGRDFVCIYY